MKTSIVAGGSGFIGSHLCDFLINLGNKVICIDNLISGDCKNVEHLMTNENFIFLYEDICDTNIIDKLNKFKIDNVYHLASPASPIAYQSNPKETLYANSFGTKNLLDIALKNQPCKFLFASTSEIYGDPLEHPQKETYWGNVNPIGPRSMYDESKRFGEALTTLFKNEKDLSISIARIFNTYGPKMKINDGRVVPNFIMQSLQNLDITVYGNGTQTRSFCYVEDTILGLFKLIHSGIHTPINIGNPEEISILDFAKKVIKKTNSKSNITFKELPIDDPECRKPDITKAINELHWKPTISLSDGLDFCISYFKNC